MVIIIVNRIQQLGPATLTTHQQPPAITNNQPTSKPPANPATLPRGTRATIHRAPETAAGTTIDCVDLPGVGGH